MAQDLETPDEITVSVILPVKNKKEFLPAVFDALAGAVDAHGRAEIIVVDNGSTDGAYEWLLNRGNSLRVFQSSGNVASVRNVGALHARGDILVFLDSDVRVERDHLINVELLIEQGTAEAVGCECNIPEDPIWIERIWYHLTVERKNGYREYLNSGNFAIRRDVFVKISGFPENFDTGEDTEICRAIRGEGWRIYQCASLDAVHLGNPQTVGAFYRRFVWHGASAFNAGRLTLHHRSAQAALVHMFLTTIAVGVLSYAVWNTSIVAIAVAFVCILATPCAVFLYWSRRSERSSPILPSLFLIAVMLYARAHAIARGLAGIARRSDKLLSL